MNPKVILAVTNDTFTDQRIHKIAQTLSKNGFEVTITGKKSHQQIVQPSYAIVKRLPVFFKKGFLFYAEFNIRLFIYLLQTPANIITANDLDTLPAVVLAAKIKGRKIMYDSHEYFTESPEIFQRSFVKFFWKTTERLFIRHADAATTVSDSIAYAYKLKYNIDFQVVRNLPLLSVNSSHVDLPSFFNRYKVIIYQGSLNVGRGIENAIMALKYTETDIGLVVAGAGDIENELKMLASNEGVGNRILFPGRIHPSELTFWTKNAFLGFSLEEDLGKNYRFALPNKLFDYIHAEIPVLISDLPEMKAIVNEYGVGKIAMDTSPENLGKMFTHCILNTDLREKWIENCRLAKSTLNWEKESDVLVKLYEKLVL